MAVCAVLFVWTAFCVPYIAKGKIPFPSSYLVTFFPPWNTSYGMPVKNNAMPDVITQIFPWKKITIDSWKLGQIPLWNPYSFAGTVHAGNYQSAVFSPLTILFFLLPFLHAWSLSVLLQPLLAALGMYLFVRSLGKSSEAALTSALAFMLCGFMTTWMAYATLGYAALALPYALFAVHEYMKKNRWWYLIVLWLALAWSFVSGHFQISLYVLAATVLFILFETLSSKKWKQGWTMLLFVVLSVLFVSPQILLTFHSYLGSTRSASFIQGEVIPWKYLITTFAPDFYGNPVTRNDWFGHYAEWASYIGVVPLFFALFAAVKKPKGYIRFFAVLALFALFFAYPTPLNSLLFALKLPVISTSAASRIIILFSFSLAVLSAYGLDELKELWQKKEKKTVCIFSAIIMVAVFSIWAVVLVGKPFSAEANVIAKRNLVVPTGLLVAAVFIALSGFVKKMKWYIPVTIAVLVVMADMYRFAAKWMPFDDSRYVYPPMNILTYLTKTVGENRVFGNIGGEASMMYDLSLVEGYDAMYQGRFGEFLNAAANGIVAPGGRSVVTFDKYGRYKNEVMQLLGVRYILYRVSDGKNVWAFPVWEYPFDEMKQVYKDEHFEVYEYTKSFPRAFLASSYEVLMDKQRIIDRLFDTSFDRRNAVILETTPDSEPSTGAGEAKIISYTPNRVTIQTTSEGAKLLFLSDVYDAGWEATIDGKKTPVYRADYDFRAVAVPSGTHTIEYRYHPVEFRIGIVIAVASIVFGAVALLWIHKKNH